MLTVFVSRQPGFKAVQITQDNQALLEEAIWIDLLCPTLEEETLLEQYIKFDVPTKKEMAEIEPSSRLYKENGALFMTSTMLEKSETLEPKTDAVTFVLTANKLLTVRYIEPLSFKIFIARLSRLDPADYSPEGILMGLLESTTERLADILENIIAKYDEIAQMIFHAKEKIDYKQLLQTLGVNGDLEAKARESLVSFNRLIYFFEETSSARFDAEIQSRLKIVNRDISALSDHANFLSTKLNFLLDATLGMVNIEQNNIIKIFSVAAVIFLPPTLIASIYGMNFIHMPELKWYLGYPFAVALMIFSSWLPYRYFKSRKWL